jgi:hypothetical protein
VSAAQITSACRWAGSPASASHASYTGVVGARDDAATHHAHASYTGVACARADAATHHAHAASTHLLSQTVQALLRPETSRPSRPKCPRLTPLQQRSQGQGEEARPLPEPICRAPGRGSVPVACLSALAGPLPPRAPSEPQAASPKALHIKTVKAHVSCHSAAYPSPSLVSQTMTLRTAAAPLHELCMLPPR